MAGQPSRGTKDAAHVSPWRAAHGHEHAEGASGGRHLRLAAGWHWHALDSNWLCLGTLGRWLDAP